MNIPLPYLFYVLTTFGRVRIDFPATPWEVGTAPEITGEAAAITQLRDKMAVTLGPRGHLLNLDLISPLELDFALAGMGAIYEMAGPRYDIPTDDDKRIVSDELNDVDLAGEE